MTVSETLKLIAKQLYYLNDLIKLAGVGRNNALVIKSTIKKRLESVELLCIYLRFNQNFITSIIFSPCVFILTGVRIFRFFNSSKVFGLNSIILSSSSLVNT